MTWVRIDDNFFRHPKALAAGKDGRELYIAGLCYCASQLTDGHIPSHALPVIAAEAQVKPTIARRLVDVGLWEPEDDGYTIHAYLDYQPSADRVKQDRDDAKERMRRVRSGKRSPRTTDNGSAEHQGEPPPEHGENFARSSSSPSHPIPSLTKSSSSHSRLSRPEPDDNDDFWALVAQRRLAAERSAGRPITNERAWLATTARNAKAELADRAHELNANFVLEPAQLADALNGNTNILRSAPRR